MRTSRGGWLLARLARAALAAWGIASLVFVVSRLLPGGPEQLALEEAGEKWGAAGQAAPTQQAARRSFRHRLGLDEPVFYVTRAPAPVAGWHWHGRHNQYHRWLGQLLHGSLGQSYRDGQPVGAALGRALIYTLPLTGSAAVLATGLALALALYLAGAPTGRGRALVRTLLGGLQTIPLFLLALLLLLLLANPDGVNLIPTGQAPDAATSSLGQGLSYWGPRSLLPLLSLVLALLPSLTLPLAAALHHELGAGYATTARAKGLPIRQLLRRHALPNALIPLLTTLADLLPSLVAGTVVVEVVFALPGSGRLLAQAAATHDYPVVVAGVLLTALVRLLGLLLADALYFALDPRLRPLA